MSYQKNSISIRNSTLQLFPVNKRDTLRLFWLLTESQSWVHRRIDALRLSTEGYTRRFVSLDFTIPKKYGIPLNRKQIVAPIGLLEKRYLRKLDVQDSSGRSLSVLETAHNASYAISFLLAMMPTRVSNNKSAFDSISDIIVRLVFSDGDPKNVSDISRELMEALEEISPLAKLTSDEKQEHQLFLGIASQFGEHFLLLIALDEATVGRRTLVKYALDQDSPEESRLPSQRVTFGFNIPDYGFAASQHVEVEVPKGLVIKSAIMLDTSNPNIKRIPADCWDSDSPSIPRRVAHVSLNPKSRIARGFVQVTATAAKQDLYWFSINSAIIVSLLMGLIWSIHFEWISPFLVKPPIPSYSVSLILLGPALLLSWFSRNPEHPIVAKRLGPLRRSMLLNATVLVILAVMAAIQLSGIYWNGLWYSATVVQGISIVYLLFFLLDARSWPARLLALLGEIRDRFRRTSTESSSAQ